MILIYNNSIIILIYFNLIILIINMLDTNTMFTEKINVAVVSTPEDHQINEMEMEMEDEMACRTGGAVLCADQWRPGWRCCGPCAGC